MEALIPPAAAQSSTAHGCSNVAQHTGAGQCQSWPPVPAAAAGLQICPRSDPSPAGWAAHPWQKNQETPPGAPISFYSQLVPPRDEVTQKIWLFLGVLHFVSPGQAMPELSVHSCWQQALCKHTQTASRHDTSTSPSPCCSQRCCSTSDSPVAPAPCLCEPRAAGEAGC